jgi:Xaa-Pro aminopeptidase
MISNAELDRRWALTRTAMQANGLDWLVATSGHPFGYLRWLTNRVGLAGTLVAFPAAGEALLASHGDPRHDVPISSHGVRQMVSYAQPNLTTNTHAPLLAEAIRSSGARRVGMLGLGYMSAAAYLAVSRALPGVELVDASDLIAPIKAVKSEEELTCARRSAAMHDDAVALLHSLVRPGRTGRDILIDVRHALAQAGSPAQTLMAGSAPAGTPCAFYGPAERTLERGDQFAMLIEAAEPDGYYTEAMPMVCLGQPPDGLRRAFDHAVEAQERVLELLRPGADPNDLLRANDAFLVDKGYTPEGRLLGHAQGVDLVERPALTPAGDTLALQANMVFALHPTVYAPTACANPVNQIFLIRDGAPERMLRTPQEIIVV